MTSPEEQARANLYGLLARLFYAPPDAALLKAIAGEALEGELAVPWRAVASAAAAADPEAVREEYETAFIGTGKAPVTLYTTAYSIRHPSEAPLAGLRGELAKLGLARRAGAYEPEDHVAALFDTMRHFVAKQKDLEAQRGFFSRWIHPTVEPLCTAIELSDKTSFYKTVARFTNEFCTREHMAFELL
jgi:TorA maturation chaperone TorD